MSYIDKWSWWELIFLGISVFYLTILPFLCLALLGIILVRTCLNLIGGI